MMMRVYVSRDAGAVAVGADDVALALEQVASKRGIAIETIRTGSRGLYWLEPMVEIASRRGASRSAQLAPVTSHRWSTLLPLKALIRFDLVFPKTFPG